MDMARMQAIIDREAARQVAIQERIRKRQQRPRVVSVSAPRIAEHRDFRFLSTPGYSGPRPLAPGSRS